jgi:uncharacterized membrane protein
MIDKSSITTTRLEAFSDGVIAIIITIMVFDLKLNEVGSAAVLEVEFYKLLPKLFAYLLSFLMIAIMWVNHHQLIHQIKSTDRKLLWLNIHLLFWISLLPFCSNFLGANPILPIATMCYSIVLFMVALSFTWIRSYAAKHQLINESVKQKGHSKAVRKNALALFLYAASALLGFISVYISFCILLLVPAMYFIPEKIEHS